MNDHRNHRYRESGPAWPSGDDSDPRASARGAQEEPPERTGFWSPLWEDDDEPPARPSHGHGRHEAASNGRARHEAADPGAGSGGNGHRWPDADAGDHRWPDAEPPAAPKRPPAPPRPSPRSSGPGWP
ncbi:MAG: hypothetical protein WBA97_15900, partial [Actinophytocola sp.]